MDRPSDGLAHYGVKGMKWGVRKDRGHEGERVKTKKLAKLDKKYERKMNSVNGWIEINNSIADEINPQLPGLNSKPQYKEVNMLAPENNQIRKKYYKDYEKILQKAMDDTVVKLGTNASGTRGVQLSMNHQPDGVPYWTARIEDVKHDDTSTEFVIRPKFDKTGHIVGQDITPSAQALMPDGMEMVDFLMHYGVKGMKWGVRKNRPSAADGPVEVNTTANPGRRVKTTGGQFHNASPDAIKKAKYHQIAKKSSVDALSNDELKLLVERMNLEVRYNELNFKTKSQGEQWVVNALKNPNAARAQVKAYSEPIAVSYRKNIKKTG